MTIQYSDRLPVTSPQTVSSPIPFAWTALVSCCLSMTVKLTVVGHYLSHKPYRNQHSSKNDTEIHGYLSSHSSTSFTVQTVGTWVAQGAFNATINMCNVCLELDLSLEIPTR